MWVTNWRNGAFSVIANGTEHKLATIPITGLISGGTNCTATTPVPHGLTTGPAQLNGFAGWTISQNVYCADETKWFGGLDGPHYAFQTMVPLVSNEIVAGQNNTISFKFYGSSHGSADITSEHGGWLLDWNIVQPDFQMSQKVVSGTNATATTNATNNFNPGDTVLFRDAPGPRLRFNGKRVLTATAPSTLSSGMPMMERRSARLIWLSSRLREA